MAGNSVHGQAHRRRRRWVLEHYDTCCRCGKPVDKTLPGRHPWGPTYDHLVPRAKGGSVTDLANAGLAHNRCNAAYRDGRKLKPVTTWRSARSASGTC